jgi:thiamine-monophosphate kinase
LATHPAARGLIDDAAVLELGGEMLILTHDSMVEGTHFRGSQDPADVAWKLVATNLSDLAAKGGEPLGVLLSYSMGDNDARFVAGLEEALDRFDVPLLGGDTVRGEGPKTLGLTAIGRATHTPVPSRSGAKQGDAIYVTGTLGNAMIGFERLDDPTFDHSAFTRPMPLIEQGRLLAPHVTAMMDVSDGLLLDCWRMASASGAGFRLQRGLIPVAEPARFDECVRWGDDYQLLFTLPGTSRCPVEATCIGHVGNAPGSLWLDSEQLSPQDGLGYQH